MRKQQQREDRAQRRRLHNATSCQPRPPPHPIHRTRKQTMGRKHIAAALVAFTERSHMRGERRHAPARTRSVAYGRTSPTVLHGAQGRPCALLTQLPLCADEGAPKAAAVTQQEHFGASCAAQTRGRGRGERETVHRETKDAEVEDEKAPREASHGCLTRHLCSLYLAGGQG